MPPNPSSTEASQLIEGNYEDIDFVIASGRDLIFIEAKAYVRWDDAKLRSKLDRLDKRRAHLQR